MAKLKHLRPHRTKLARFLDKEGIKPSHLSMMRACSRRHLIAMRMGINEPTLSMMLALARACSRMLGRTVRVAEMFDLGKHN